MTFTQLKIGPSYLLLEHTTLLVWIRFPCLSSRDLTECYGENIDLGATKGARSRHSCITRESNFTAYLIPGTSIWHRPDLNTDASNKVYGGVLLQ